MQKNFEYNVESNGISYKYARGERKEIGKEFHVFHEILLFLGDEAELITENSHMTIKPDTIFAIPKETYHQFITHGNRDDYHRCILSFYDKPGLMDIIDDTMRDVIVIKADKSMKFLFQNLTDNIKNKYIGKIMESVLVLLLNELKGKNEFKIENEPQDDVIREAIDFINTHINEKITLSDISKNCNIAPSSLSHMFKKEMNISVHSFILKKRLIGAYSKISAGEAATTAAIECGFNDYSGFYKQYKKMFGIPPSQTK